MSQLQKSQENKTLKWHRSPTIGNFPYSDGLPQSEIWESAHAQRDPDSGETFNYGVVLSVVLDLMHHTSFLLILDASTMQELARAETPHAIPPGLHGFWRC